MKYIMFAVFLVTLSGTALSQKIKIKDNVATVDAVPFLKWDKRNMVEISIMGINSTEEEIYAMWLDYSDPTKITKSNPEGKVRWIELNFLTLNKKCEIDSRGQNGLVKFIYENKIYVDNALSAENVDKVIAKYGMRFTQNRPGGGNVNIYINN